MTKVFEQPESTPPVSIEEVIETLKPDEAWSFAVKFFASDIKNAFDSIQRVLCIQPHPDDTDIAAGGTIAKLVKKGITVIYVTLTDGRLGTVDPQMWPEKLAALRRKEQEEAARILGVKELVWLNYRDTELLPTLEVRWELIRLIRKYKPDMIMTPDPWLTYEAHPDHRATGLLAAEAAYFSPLPHSLPGGLEEGLSPHGPRYVAFYWTRKPNTFIDVTDYIDVKLKAVMSHKTQMGDSPVFEQLLKAYMRVIGKLANYKYAEAFKVLTPQHLHSNEFTEDI